MVNNKSPRVSIGMPVYNCSKFVREALDSILNQTFSDFELIISDNASTDDTGDICKEYCRADNRVRYIRQNKNLGAAANFQFVLAEAIGEYFMWAAADDRRDPRFLAMAIDVFESDERVGLVFSDMITKDLVTGDEIRFSPGFSGHESKIKRYMFRLFSTCASLVYGLHKTDIIKNGPRMEYDYSDVHLTHWYEINFFVKVIPIPLYIAGTTGIRIPYGLKKGKISCKDYICFEFKLLMDNFSLFSVVPLIIVQSIRIFRSTMSANNLRKWQLRKCSEE